MKKLTKQSLLQQQTNSPAPPGSTSANQGPSAKKKAKTSSNSFTPHTKSAAHHSDMHIPMQRFSIGTNETPLAMNKNFEYFAQTAAGAAAQSAAQRSIGMGTMHKPSHSQLAPNIGMSHNEHQTGLTAASVKNSNKISTLKNKAAFEKFHPSQQLATAQQSQQLMFDPSQQNAISKGHHSHHNSVATMPSSAANLGTLGTAQSTAVISKLSHYQKMSSGPQKRTYVRGSSKKNPHGVGDHGIASNQMMSQKMHISSQMLDEKVKKSSSQSLIKMQAAQMMGAQHQHHYTHVDVKERTTTQNSASMKDEAPRISKQVKNMGGHQTGSKKAIGTEGGTNSGSTSKKLIFSFKKESKQKITPPNVSNAVPNKPAMVGHHRRVQSHGQAIQNFNLKTEQPTTKVHSPKVEKASYNDMISSHQTSTMHGGHTDAASSGQGLPSTQPFLHHPALSKHYKQEYQLNKSKTSGGVSHASLNASHEQVSVISLNSFSRSTPKFTQGLSLPQSVMNYQVGMSRAANLPAKMLSPQSQTQVNKQNINQMAPGKTISIKEKKGGGQAVYSVPNEGVPSTIGAEKGLKKIGKIQKHQKLRLKHTQSTVQPANSAALATSTAARQSSPEVKGNNGGYTMKNDNSSKAQALPTFDMKQMSSRNPASKSSSSTKELLQSASPIKQQQQPSQYQSNNAGVRVAVKKQKNQTEGTSKQRKIDTIQEEFQLANEPTNFDAQVSSASYKVLSKPHHQKSQSYGQPSSSQPGIYNMYMGQVNQLKKQRLTINKAGMANNTQPTHFINLNTDQNENQLLVNDKSSLENLKKNSSLMMQTSKVKMSVTGKAPNKLHLTNPPSAHDEKSQNDLLPQQESTSQDQDTTNRDLQVSQSNANVVPPSLLQTSHPAQMANRQQLRMTSSNGNIVVPNSLMNSSQKLQVATLTTPQSNQPIQSTKNLSIKHKQLAKAIKQQQHAMVRQTDAIGSMNSMPMTTKALKQKTDENDSELLSEQHQFINATMSPKNFKGKIKNHSQTMSPPNQNIVTAGPPQPNTAHTKRMSHDQNMQQAVYHQQNEYLSERKRNTNIGRVGGSSQLDPLGVERQRCWQSPGGHGATSVSDNDSAAALAEVDYVPGNRVKNIMKQDGGQKSQQISAQIIRKIQNNYQVQVTNGYDSTMTTESAKALQSITQRIKNETTSVLPYLHALQEISEIYPNNNPLNTLLSQIHQGISTMILSKEDQIQQSNMHNQNINKIIEEKDEQLKQALEQIQNLEMNEEETRRHVHQMTQQIDDRDAQIDKLEQKILGHNKRARLMFKKQMASRAERPQLDLIFDGNCSELERQSDERRKVFQENEELQSAIDELNEDMAYGKQRENKLMFFLYILKQMGYPISEVFEREIKDVPTSRFSKNFDDEYKVMHAQLWKERREAKKEAKLIQQNGFAIDRDEVLIEQFPKSDRLVPMSVENGFNSVRYSSNRLPSGALFEDDSDLNFYPLQMGPIEEPRRPDNVPQLNINKVLIIKHRRAKGLSVGNMVNRTDSQDQQSQSSDESLDSRGRPKRCPKPRLHKKILDQYGIQTGARNIMALEAHVFKQRVQEMMLRSNSRTSEVMDDELRYSLNSQRAESMQSQRI